MAAYNARFRVWRGDDTDGALEDFSVEVRDGEVVLDIIHRLQATQTPDLAVRWNCKAGKCGSCSAEINGRPRLLCMTRMSTFTEDEVVTVTPLRAFPVVKDLVTDVSFNYQKAREVPAFAPPADLAPGEYRMAQVDVERSQEFRKCIECFLCQNTCHVVRDHEENKQSFAGPRFFIRLAELDMHPLDARDRKREAQAQHGLGMCNITKCCTEVCPEGIKITDNAIIPMKERVVDTQYDPLVWLGSKIPRRSTMAASRSLSSGDTTSAESQARARLQDRPADTGALKTLAESLNAQGRFADAAEASRALVDNTGRSRTGRLDAMTLHTWTLLCAVESGQLPLDRVEDEIASTLGEAQRAASTGTVLEGAHALHQLINGRLAEAAEHAREAIAWDRDRYTRADDLVTLSEALAGLGEGDEAADALSEAQGLWPDNPRLAGVRANLADMNVGTT
jgi:succinate dehydrogenase / fumarate reductase iron-sulfur subunit